MVVVVMAWAAHAACPDDPEGTLVVEARQVLQAYDAADAELLTSARTGLDATLPCLQDRPDAGTLVALHRAMALVAYADRDRERATRAWRAARQVDPALGPDPRRFAPEHGMWQVYAAAATSDPSRRVPLPGRPRGGWWVDGVRRSDAPADRAFVLSARGRRDQTLFAGYLYRPGDVPTLDFETLDPDPKQTVRRVTRVGAGLFGAVALGLAAWGASDELGLNGGRFPPTEVRPLQRTVNRRYALAVGFGAVGLGLGVVSWTIR